MTERRAPGRSGRPRISSFDVLHDAARRFRPQYEIAERSVSALRLRLRDPRGVRPDLVVRHRHDRRLFFRANYLVVEADIPGDGPSTDGELRFRFRGPLSRQRASLRWRSEVPEGERWTEMLQTPLLDALDPIGAVESLHIWWRARNRSWHLELKTLSGSMVGGFMTAMPIAVPLEAGEVEGIVGLVDALASTRA
jgi:hypothetical protein